MNLKNLFRALPLLIPVLLVLSPCILFADPPDNWHWRNPLPQGNTLYSVAHGNSTFVAVGSFGTILTSADGVSWTIRKEGGFGDDWLYDISYGDNIFVALGGESVLTSLDGINWTKRSSPAHGLYGITYGDNIFVAVGTMGTILTSPNGIDWTKRDFGITVRPKQSVILGDVVYGNNVFVTVGSIYDYEEGIYEELILTSPDGINWIRRPLGFTTQSFLSRIAYGNNAFVAVGGNATILTSPDGVHWTDKTIETVDCLGNIMFGDNTFLGVGTSFEMPDGNFFVALTSPDGMNWTVTKIDIPKAISEIVWVDNTYVAVGDRGVILISPDGINWTNKMTGTTAQLIDIAHGNNNFVALGEAFDDNGILEEIVLTSQNGISWAVKTLIPPRSLSDVHTTRYVNNLFAAVGDVILTSPDGVEWTERINQFSLMGTLYDIAYGNDRFVAVGSGSDYEGLVVMSPDGINWTKRTINYSNVYPWSDPLIAIVNGKNMFVALSGRGTVLTSPDGVTWTVKFSGALDNSYEGMAYGNGTFVAVGNCATLTSEDGVTWTARSLEIQFGKVSYVNGIFFATASNDSLNVLTSPDGALWTELNLPISLTWIHGMAYGNGTFVVVGDWGTILQSDPVSSDIFSDVPTGHWAYDYINAIYNAQITTGCSQNPLNYCPEDNVTREQMAAFIVRAVEGEPAANYCDSGTAFPDVTPGMWSCRYIKRLKELGITTGYQDGTYGPYDLVPREQMAAFIVRAVEGEPAANYCDSGSLFPDVTPDMWSCRYIKRLKELGITTGYEDGRYGPYDLVTRAQMAAFLARAFLGME